MSFTPFRSSRTSGSFNPAHALASSLLLAAALCVTGCHAQAVPPPGSPEAKMSPEMSRRIALMIRTKAGLPFNYDVKVGERKPSTISGYDEVTIYLGEYGKPSRPTAFLISKDDKTLAQMNTFDLSHDPRTLVEDTGRPARGGPEKSPVTIVVFDDLECPFCARMHEQIFPGLLARYGDKVRISYKDFPLTQIHPWAIHAAVDADCLADQSPAAYWSLVDYMHAHLDEIGLESAAAKGQPAEKSEKTLSVALKQIDRLTLDEGARAKVDQKRLSACVERQEESSVRAYMKEGDGLNVTGVPALFINGESITGAVPIEYVYRAVDDALTAQGITPPPPVPLPSLDAPPAATSAK